MVKIAAFKGIRYNPEKVSFSNVITPPYDVISSEEQNELYQRSDYNLIRLEYGSDYAEDNEQNNRYTRAAQTFSKWLESDVLIQENSPVYYWYEQQYNWKGTNYTREGLIATLRVEPYENGNVLPHEETLSKPKEDRLQLLQHCRANFSPIFGLYPDPQRTVENECAPVKEKQPIIDFTDQDNQSHRIWIIDDAHMHQRLEEIFESWPVFLADGHHRYETALYFSQIMGSNAPDGYHHVLIFLFNFYSPGLLILPTHRAIKGLDNFNTHDFLSQLEKYFTVVNYSPSQKEYLPDFIKEIRGKSHDHYIIGLCISGYFYQLHLNNQEEEARHDVDILQKYVLENTLKITADELREGELILYTRSEEEALRLVNEGEAQASFFLNPSSIKQVMASAQEGQRLPQKSTYFYPKLVSGLLLNILD